MVFIFLMLLLSMQPPHRGCAGGRIGTRFLGPRGTSPLKGVNPAGTPGYRNGTESFFGLKGRPSVVRDVEIHNQPVLRMRRKPRSRVERLPPSPHVNEPSVTAHYQHYAHDE